MEPPLDHKEVTVVVSQLNKKDYNYKCKDQPIVSYCNSIICKLRKYGIDGSDLAQALGELTKLDTKPPQWFLENPNDTPDEDDYKIQLSTEELQIQTKFQRRAMDV